MEGKGKGGRERQRYGDRERGSGRQRDIYRERELETDRKTLTFAFINQVLFMVDRDIDIWL